MPVPGIKTSTHLLPGDENVQALAAAINVICHGFQHKSARGFTQ